MSDICKATTPPSCFFFSKRTGCTTCKSGWLDVFRIGNSATMPRAQKWGSTSHDFYYGYLWTLKKGAPCTQNLQNRNSKHLLNKWNFLKIFSWDEYTLWNTVSSFVLTAGLIWQRYHLASQKKKKGIFT